MAKRKSKKSKGKVSYQLEIPEEYETDDEKLDFLMEDIEDRCSSLIGKEGNTTQLKIKIGKRLIGLQTVLKRLKKPFNEYLENNLPFVVRSAQRWKRLAKINGIEQCPNLTCLGDTRLLALSTIVKNEQPLHKYLRGKKISTDFDEEDIRKVHKFREKVQGLIDKKGTKKKRPLKKMISNLRDSLHKYSADIQSLPQKNYDGTEKEKIQTAIDDAEALIKALKILLSGNDDDVDEEFKPKKRRGKKKK